MNQPELLLLSPHQLPGQNPLVLSNEDMACWLNAYSALWHPAVLWQAAQPPRVASAYDHETPKPGHIYAVPETPPLLLPENWQDQLVAAGAISFRATPDRQATLQHLQEAVAKFIPVDPDGSAGPTAQGDDQSVGPVYDPAIRKALLDLSPDLVGPFFGIGLGYILVATLCEAMEHENLLAVAEFWEDVQKAIAALAGVPYQSAAADGSDSSEDTPVPLDQGVTDEFGNYRYQDADESAEESTPEYGSDYADADENDSSPESTEAPEPPEEFGPEACRRHLQAAADRLQSAREVLYPVAMHVLDIYLLDEQRLGAPLPAAVEQGQALNVIAASLLLEKMGRDHPEQLALLREKVQSEQIEVCGGSYLEREDALLPMESQVWNLAKGLAVAKDLLGSDLRVYARKRFAAHPQLPMLLGTVGLQRTLLLSFDEAVLPTYQVTVVNWPAPDGKQIEAFTRPPYPADNPQTVFHLAHHLFQTIRQDHSATLALLHTGSPPQPWYADWLELCRFGPILGQWTTFSHYFNDVLAGEHASSLSADEFQSDYLSERIAAHTDAPVNWFPRQVRTRRRLDTVWTLAALYRGLMGRQDSLRLQGRLSHLEDQLEDGAEAEETHLLELEKEVLEALAGRLQAHAADNTPGYMILNPCSFARRVALELEGGTIPLPVTGQVKACQLDGQTLRTVIEVPALGFAWIPQAGPVGTPPPPMRMRLADNRCVRNEFFEAEIDQETGGLRALRDHRARNNRIGQRLIFNPGGTARCNSVTVTSAGPALGEIITEGAILGDQEQVLAKFRQRFRAWLGRPILDLRI